MWFVKDHSPGERSGDLTGTRSNIARKNAQNYDNLNFVIIFGILDLKLK